MLPTDIVLPIINVSPTINVLPVINVSPAHPTHVSPVINANRFAINQDLGDKVSETENVNVDVRSQHVIDMLIPQSSRASQRLIDYCVNCALVLSAQKEQMISKRLIKRGSFHILVTLIRR